jgi:hypothetical protein
VYLYNSWKAQGILCMKGFCEFVSESRVWGSGWTGPRRLAVEASFFLNSVLIEEREPLLGAVGGDSRKLCALVRVALSSLRCVFDSQLLFVFSGLSPPESPFEVKPGFSPKNWSVVDGEATFKSVDEFGRSESALWRVLRSLNVECLVAPQRAWAQLAYFAENDLVDFVLGSPVNLLVGRGAIKLVTNLSTERNDFMFVDGEVLYSKLGVSVPHLLDALLLAKNKSGNRQFESPKLQFAKLLSTAKKMSMSTSFEPTLAALALSHMIVLHVDCSAQIMQQETAPDSNVMSRLFGLKLPDFVYFFMSEGAVKASLLDVMVTSRLVETVPRFVLFHQMIFQFLYLTFIFNQIKQNKKKTL